MTAAVPFVAPGSLVRFATGSGPAGRLGIVARLQPEVGAAWVFSIAEDGKLELGDDGAPRATPVAAAELEPLFSERRDTPRRHGECLVRTGHADGPAALAWLRDISSDGAGFLLAQDVPVGTRLRLEILATTRGGALAVGAEVMSSSPLDNGQRRIGCRFERRLSPDELAALVP